MGCCFINSGIVKNIQILMMGANKKGYGLLYNWYAAGDVNFAPTDWHLPSDIEIGATFGTGILYSMKEVGTKHWNTSNGTDTDNFTAIGSGYRSSLGVYSDLKSQFIYWSEEAGTFTAYYASLLDNGSHDFTLTTDKRVGGAVRLVYLGAGTPTTVTDYDGNIYDVVNINGYYWTKQNWKCTRLNNGTEIPNVTDATAWGGLSTGARCVYNNDNTNL